MGTVTKTGALGSALFGGGPGVGGSVTAAAMAAALTATDLVGRADVRRTGRTTTYTTVADEAAMLALLYVNQGDRIWRTDTESIWTLRVAPAWGEPSVLGSWHNEGQPPGIDAEAVRDTVAAMIAAGSHSGITITHDDAGNALAFTVTGGGGGAGSTSRAITPLVLERFYTAASLPPISTNNVKLARVVIPRALLLIPGVTIRLDGVVRGGGATDVFSGTVKLGPAGTAFSDAAMNIVGVISASAVGTTSSFGVRLGVDPDDATKVTTLMTAAVNPYASNVTDSVTTSLTNGVHEVVIPGGGDMELAIGCNVGATDRPYAGFCTAEVINPAAAAVTPVSREITGATTLGPTDINTTHRFNSGSTAAITVPADSALGVTPGQAMISVFIQGTAVPTFAGSGGATILDSPPPGLAQNKTVVLSHTGVANTWSYA